MNEGRRSVADEFIAAMDRREIEVQNVVAGLKVMTVEQMLKAGERPSIRKSVARQIEYRHEWWQELQANKVDFIGWIARDALEQGSFSCWLVQIDGELALLPKGRMDERIERTLGQKLRQVFVI